MKRSPFILLALVALCVFSAEYLFAQERSRTNIDDDWKFHFGNASDPSKDFNYRIANIMKKTGNAGRTCIAPDFVDSLWTTVQLPHDWAVALPFVQSPNEDVMAHGYKPVGGLFPESSIGWYRKKFMIQPSDSGQRFSVTFDGVYRDAVVWLNGHYLGNNTSGYIGKTYDITDIVNFNAPNVLVVRVDATQYEGWFYEGAGIYRHVWLNRHHSFHIVENGMFVTTVIGSGDAAVKVATVVENQLPTPVAGTVQTVIADREGRVVAQSSEAPCSFGMNERRTVTHTLTVLRPSLWSLDDPYRYRAESIVRANGKIIDRVGVRFGIRTITIDALNGVMVNGRPVKIQGVNCHQDHAGVGSALPDYLQGYRIRLLKDMGATAYRTSHNPPTPELLDACDSLGMLVLDETRLLNSGSEYIDQFARLIMRDRNHPSVFMWSIGNEEGYVHTTSAGKRIAITMLAKQRELDPTRTSTYAADVANVFQGVNEVIPVRGFNYRVNGIVPYHADHGDQPIIGTEMGSTVTTRGIYETDTIRCYVPDQDITFPWWANRAEDWWPLAAEHPWMMGGFVWTGFDYRGEPTPYQWPNINSHFGIMDMCGFPKNIYYYYQSWWSQDDVIHLSPHWNWKGAEGKHIDVWVNSNADSVELFLNAKSLGMKRMVRYSHLKWDVLYTPGALEAVGYRSGKRITARVETTGDPFVIRLTPSKVSLSNDGRDAVVINVSVIDREGRDVPDAQNEIVFSLRGAAKFIGVGNGDPSSHEPDQCVDGAWQRKLFNGRCQVIVQGGHGNEGVTIEAAAKGLNPATLMLRSHN
ncbi:MAG TPA: beta-galactosidase GalA [Bacteroidota bacterium]|nr:beta-galactosidase GalA [Bacteroidota bacterium]